MAKHKIGIEIQTTRTGTGAQAVENELQQVRSAADDVRQALDRAGDEMIGGPEDRARLAKLADQLDNVARSGEQVATVQTKGAKSTRNGGLAFLEFSRAVEDAQYGIRGVLNNIPQMILLMGGSGGLAGVISVAAVAMSQMFTQLNKVDDQLPEANERLEEMRQALLEIHKEIGRENFETYLDRFRSLDALLTRENMQLRDNVKLLALKRKGQLEIAAMQDNLDEAKIAARLLTDDTYTPGQATQDRSDLRLKAIQREREEIEAEQADRYQEAFEARIQTAKELANIEYKIEQALRKKAILEEQHAAKMQEVRAAQELAGVAGTALQGSSGLAYKATEVARAMHPAGWATDDPFEATRREAAQTLGKAEGDAQLAKASAETIMETIQDLDRLIESSKSSVKETKQALDLQSQNLGNLEEEIQIITQTADTLTGQEVEITKLQEATRQAQVSTGEFSASLTEIQGLAQAATEARQGDKAIAATLAMLMQEVTADGIVTQQDLARINSIVTQAALQQGQATTETAAAVRNLQEVTRNLMGEISKMKAGQIQLSRNGTR